jgi:predicted ester cyclase
MSSSRTQRFDPPAAANEFARGTVDDVTTRLRAEYLEMPGLRLKPEQVQRLCGTERHICQIALDELVKGRFLSVIPDGQYVKFSEVDPPA